MALYWERGVSAPGLQGGPTVPAWLPVPGAPAVFWGPVRRFSLQAGGRSHLRTAWGQRAPPAGVEESHV